MNAKMAKYMNFIGIAVLALLLSSCSTESGGGGDTDGVEVGNYKVVEIPDLDAELTIPDTWEVGYDGDTVHIYRRDPLEGHLKGMISAERFSFITPDALSKRDILLGIEAQYPAIDLIPYHSTAFEGWRTRPTNPPDAPSSDGMVFFIVPGRGFLQITYEWEDCPSMESVVEDILYSADIHPGKG